MAWFCPSVQAPAASHTSVPHVRCVHAVQHTQTASGKAAHKLEAETEDFHRTCCCPPARTTAAAAAAAGCPNLRMHAYALSEHAGKRLDCSCLRGADDRVSTELKKQIVQARTAKKLTQAQLGQVGSKYHARQCAGCAHGGCSRRSAEH